MAKVTKDNAMLLDVQYIKANRKQGQPDDYLYIIWKDLDTLEKHLNVMKNPGVEIYFEKPEYRNHDYCRNYAPIETLDKKLVPYKDIIYAIAEDMGERGFAKINECFQTQNYKGLNEMYIYPYVYGADYDIRTLYRYQWMKSFTNDRPKPLSKGFLDIEVDLTNAIGFPSAEVDPIDLVTIIDTETHTSYTFCLIGIESYGSDEDKELAKKRAEIQHYYAEHPVEIITEAHQMFDENYPDMEYRFYFYEDEKKMLIHIFQLINQLKLDFMGIWNISFDIPYFIERMKVLGLDPIEVMTHPDFPIKYCWFKKDVHHFAIKNQSDFFNISAYTIYYCQMRNYAAIRKGQSELRSNRLNYIAEREIGDEKLDYVEEGNLKRLSLTNWLKYVLYNIKDVLLQTGVEDRTQDLATYYFRSYKNLTPYEHEFKQTVVLRSVQYLSFLSQGLVPGENVNQFLQNKDKDAKKYIVSEEDDVEDDEDEEGYEGALVGNPLLNGYFGAILYGKQTNNIFDFSVDFDMSAFYPSCIRANNIDPSTLIFKLIIEASQFDVRGGDLKFHGITDVQIANEMFHLSKPNKDSFVDDIGKEVMDNFQTRHYLSFGYKWLNLPDVNEMEKKLRKVMKDYA